MTGEKERVALVSIVASAALTAGKLAVGLWTGSLAILSEAAHSLLDLVATVMTWFAVRLSDKPADEEHPWGHGKVESVSALAETALLFLLSGVVMWEAGRRLVEGGHAVEASIWAFAICIVSIVVDFFRARALRAAAEKHRSHALEADALHFSSDMWSSAAVLIGLGAVALGYPWADAAAALVVAVFVILAGIRLGKRTIDTLVDAAPEGAAERISHAAVRVEGVVAVERVRVRPAGSALFAEVNAVVSRTLPIDRVAAIKDAVAAAIVAEMPEADVTVTTSPRALDDETVMERVLVIARNRGLSVHHVTIHDLDGRLAVALDLEVDGDLSLGAAHDIATALEEAIAGELGDDVEVETHIEPLQAKGIDGHEIRGERRAALAKLLESLAAPGDPIGGVHDVRVRETTDGLVVNFHCFADAGAPVGAVHEAVDALERRFKTAVPGVRRVIGHAEPKRAAPDARAAGSGGGA